ncbi:hypothetical protein AVEN_190320-1 [Araneus ventricosus]|uniref:Uncharacterized protein n=1 Tax=Araneus ventricosus TaxID=182803 RepID=A0A4Y2VY32_ARAVE|nr:hypothetical protein AVEN_98747-1 [Araneus ventricosus]GBO28667.1 hypothetical protein AVEN_190320-1 [Araneus ventricosus]
MCLDLCRSEFSKAYYGRDLGMTMISSVSDLCCPNKYTSHKCSSSETLPLGNRALGHCDLEPVKSDVDDETSSGWLGVEEGRPRCHPGHLTTVQHYES